MIRGLLASQAGMLSELERSEKLSADLANQTLPGYRRQLPVFETFGESMLSAWAGRSVSSVGSLGGGSRLAFTGLALEEGTVEETGHNTDLTLLSQGFLTVKTPSGLRYTRNGNLALADDGSLVTATGMPVLGRGGNSIKLAGIDFKVTPAGEVVAGDQVVDTLAVVRFDDDQALVHESDGLYTPTSRAGQARPAAEVVFRQGALEESNVNPIITMMSMMAAMRAYEANQKALSAQDDILGKAVNEIGRV